MKPNYYQKGGIECLDAIKAATEGLTGFEGFLIGNVIKYCWRWNKKGGVADLEKAAEYIRRLVAVRAANRPYTLDELIAKPDGTRVWVEERQPDDYESAWHTKRSNTLTADSGRYYVIESDDPDECAFGGDNEERAWPTPPSVEDVARWPWGDGGKE